MYFMHTMILDHKEKMILGIPWTLLQLNYKLKRSFMMGLLSVMYGIYKCIPLAHPPNSLKVDVRYTRIEN